MLEWEAHHKSMTESCPQILKMTEDGKFISTRKGYRGCGIFNEKRWKRQGCGSEKKEKSMGKKQKR